MVALYRDMCHGSRVRSKRQKSAAGSKLLLRLILSGEGHKNVAIHVTSTESPVATTYPDESPRELYLLPSPLTQNLGHPAERPSVD